MSEGIEVRVNDMGDILYLEFKKAKLATCREFGDLQDGPCRGFYYRPRSRCRWT